MRSAQRVEPAFARPQLLGPPSMSSSAGRIQLEDLHESSRHTRSSDPNVSRDRRPLTPWTDKSASSTDNGRTGALRAIATAMQADIVLGTTLATRQTRQHVRHVGNAPTGARVAIRVWDGHHRYRPRDHRRRPEARDHGPRARSAEQQLLPGLPCGAARARRPLHTRSSTPPHSFPSPRT